MMTSLGTDKTDSGTDYQGSVNRVFCVYVGAKGHSLVSIQQSGMLFMGPRSVSVLNAWFGPLRVNMLDPHSFLVRFCGGWSGG